MGIREVMVIVGGKSVGDIVELLADGAHFGLDLTYRYQRGALGHRPRHRPGPRLRRRRRVLLRPRRQHPARPGPARRRPRVRGRRRGAPARCSTGSRTRSGSASPSSTPTGRVVGFEEKPAEPKSDLIPIGVYFLRPGRVRRHRAAWRRRPRRVRDHRRPQPLHPRRPPVHPRLRRATGPTPGRCRRCSGPPSWPRDDDDGRPPRAAGRATRSADAAGRRPRRPDAPAGHRRRRVHRLVLRPRRARPARRDRITVLDKLTYAGNEANLAPVRGRPGAGRAAALRPRRHRRSGRRRAARRRRRRGRQLRRRVARRPLDPRPRGVPADRRHRRPRPARGGPREAPTAGPAASRFLQVSTDEVYGSVDDGQPREGDAARAALARTPPPRRPASCSSSATS